MAIDSIILAQATGGSGPLGVFTDYLNLGVIVVVLALLFVGKLRRESEVHDKEKEIMQLKDSLEKQLEHYQKEVLPALIEVTRVSGEVVAYLNKRRN